jgi:C1A family cysteine protease
VVAIAVAGVLVSSLCVAQLAVAPMNPEFIRYMDARMMGRWPTMTADGHALGHIPAPAYRGGFGLRPLLRPVGQPASYDLRSITNKVPPIRDQSTCGACWAFATYASVETCQRPADTSDYSEQHLKNTHGFDPTHCAGGNPYMSTAYGSRWSGPVYETDDPYNVGSSTSPSLSPRRHVQQAIWLPYRTSSTDNNHIKNAVMNYGAVYLSYNHDATHYNATNYAYYHPSATTTDHAVAIIGWDDNFAASNFNTTPAGNGAFLIRNSWGAGWGNGGYFWMSYYDSTAGRTNGSTFWSDPVVFNNADSTTNYDHNYGYDPLGWVNSVNCGWAANIFPASGSAESLDAVGFYTPSAGCSYTVYVYRNPTGGNPRSGTLAHSQSGSFTYGGYYTVPLSSPVSLPATDTSFSIVTYITGDQYPSCFEQAVGGYSSAASASAGQSYYSFNGSSFTDLTTFDSTANFCIKGFTTNVVNQPPTDPTSVTIAPTSPKTGDNLTATASGSTDPNPGDTVTYQYEWSKDDWATAGISGNPLSSTNTAKGEQWKARARATDGTLYSNWVKSSPVTIGNTPPSDPSKPTISPSSPKTGDNLTLSDGAGSTDPDSGDTVTYSYEWSKDDWATAGISGKTLDSSNTAEGEQWKGRVRAGDGTGYSNWVVSDPVTIGNTAPSDPNKPTVSPSGPKTGDNLTLSDGAGSTDPDPGDTVTYSYEWSKDDWATAGISGKTLDSSNTAEGEQWKGRVQAGDGTDYSNWVVSDPVTIGNTAPSDPDKPTISPSSPKTGEDLSLSAGAGSTDPDTGDTVTYDYEWSKDDWATAGISGQTLSSSNTAQGEQWKGRVRAYDGTDYSGWVVSDPVTIGNTAPTLEWAGTSGYLSDGIDPRKGVPGTTTFTFKVKYTDPDGTAPAIAQVAVRRLEDGRTWAHHGSWALTAAPGGSWDTGRICEASTTLPNGVYAYRFHAQDGSGAPATGDPTSWSLGPVMDAVPQLWCTRLSGRTDDFVDPNTGTAGTTRFRFAVQYTDGEGKPATMYRIEVQKQRGDGSWNAYKSADCLVWGGGPRGGKYYGWVHKLRAGQYRYRFVFRDGDGYATGSESSHADATQWQTGPTVTDGGSDAVAEADALAVSLSAASSAAGAEVVVSLSSPAEVSARVLNIAGRPVGSICRAMDCDAGANVLVWDARSASGLPVPSGMYLVEVVASAPGGAQTRALTHVRIER